jgi:threonylcarbamoyladenosine tRNA methylthiotransferase MtaB
MKVAVLTLGCRVNQAESSMIEGSLENHGFSIVGLGEKPDYCIINTCTVTGKSDYQSRQLIRRAVRTGAKVIVTGCYAQINPSEVKKIHSSIEIFSNSNKLSIINMITNDDKCNYLSYSSRSRPHIKVQDGCNFSCSYCIVPLARGRSKSTQLRDIIEQADNFAAQGFHEIVLTGIHLGFYGHDLQPGTTLKHLIRALIDKTKIHRIRLSSLEMREIDSELIELLGEERICNHLHLPLQSGDDSILSSMKRNYTTKEYRTIVELIKKKIPDISIGSDVIVGFPGEGEKEFSNTKKFIEDLPVSYMHIFPYSKRPNTLASQMQGQISAQVKKDRFSELNRININKKLHYMNDQMNRTLEIIIEEQCHDYAVIGTSSNYLKIKLPAENHARKSCVSVRVTGIEDLVLTGSPIENP